MNVLCSGAVGSGRETEDRIGAGAAHVEGVTRRPWARHASRLCAS